MSHALTSQLLNDARAWRHDFHANPELLYDVHRTAARVAELLEQFGCDEVVRNVGKSGVVGVIRGRQTASGHTIGLRADMDALPLTEITGKPYQSTVPGVMHACGHDGHTTMLLGAARCLTRDRNFDGTVVVIFQPAEENGGAGAKAMIDDGLMTRFGIERVFGMHNSPGLPAGHFSLRPGPMLASSMRFEVTLTGTGGHAGRPHTTHDPVVAAGALIGNLQTLVSRVSNPIHALVVSITQVHAGSAFNVIPETAYLAGTVRTHDVVGRPGILERFRQIVNSTAELHQQEASINYMEGYPVTVNDAAEAAFAGSVAQEIAGEDAVDLNADPSTGAEDFSFMLIERPGAMIWIGNGPSASLHNPAYDFNDEIIEPGIRYWITLAERALPLRNQH